MNATPKISVVIALYNKVAYVERTLNSVLSQTESPLEIVVIDDGSTDGSAEIVDQFRQSNIRLVRKKNEGVSKARNVGVELAQGDWVAFLDADDLWHPNYLKTLRSLIDANPDIGMVATRFRGVTADRSFEPGIWDGAEDSSPNELISDLPARWQQGTTFFTSSVAIRREKLMVRQPCFPVGESMGEDLDLWFRIAEKEAVLLNIQPLVLRISVPYSLSARVSSAIELPYLRRMELRADSSEVSSRLRRSTLGYVNNCRVTLAREMIMQGKRLDSWRLLQKSWRYATPHRWIITVLMLGLVPGQLVDAWQVWRTNRKTIL